MSHCCILLVLSDCHLDGCGHRQKQSPFCHPSAPRGLVTGFSPAQGPLVAPQCPEPQGCALSRPLGHHLLAQLQFCRTIYRAQCAPLPHLHRCTVLHKRPPFTVLFKPLSFLTAPFHLCPLHCPPGFSLVARELPKGCAPSLTHHSPRVSLGSVDSARPQKWPQLSAHPCPRGKTDN